MDDYPKDRLKCGAEHAGGIDARAAVEVAAEAVG